MSKAQRLSTWRSLFGAATSIRSISTAPTTSRVAAADRGEDERAHHQAAAGVNAIAGDRFNGRLETQPCAGTIRAGAKSGKKQESQADTRSTSPVLLLPLAGNRKTKQRPSA